MDAEAVKALNETIVRQYKARALYFATVERFGPQKPFAYLAQSAARDVQTLLGICANRDLEAPLDRWLGRVELSPTLKAVCSTAIDSESEAFCSCERLLLDIEDPTLRWALSRLAERCRYQRLPLLQRALDRQEHPNLGGRR